MELINEFRVGVPVAEAWTVLTDVERIAPCMPGAQLTEVHGDTYTGNVKVKVGPITAQYKGTATFVEKDDAAHRAVLKADGRDTRGQGNASALVTATLVADGDGTKVTVQTDLTVTGKVAQFGRGVLADVSAKLITQFVACLESDVLSADASPAPAPEAAGVAPGAPETATSTEPATPVVEPVDAPGTATATGAAPLPGTTSQPVAAGAGPAAAPVTTAVPAGSNGSGTTPSAPTGPRKIESKEATPVDLLGTAGAPVAKRVAPLVALLLLIVWLLRRRAR
jgi:hypothetical protein